MVMVVWRLSLLKDVGSGLAGTDANRLVDRRDKNFAVADAAGAGFLEDEGHHLFDKIFGQYQFNLLAGRVTLTVVPLALSGSISIVPWCSRMMWRQT